MSTIFGYAIFISFDKNACSNLRIHVDGICENVWRQLSLRFWAYGLAVRHFLILGGYMDMGMVALKCPACGADIQLDENREFGFCNYCGTKVMQEKIVVEHQGSVKVDNSEYVEKFLQNARRAKQKEDWDETEKYYNLVEQNDPTNIEAIFYSSYAKAKRTLIEDDILKRSSAFKVLINCVSIIDDNFDIDKETEQKEIIKQISDDIITLTNSSYVYKPGGLILSEKEVTRDIFNTLNTEFCTTLLEIIKKYPPKDMRVTLYYELAITHRNMEFFLKDNNIFADRPQCGVDIINYHEKWHEIDSNHEVPTLDEVKQNAKDIKFPGLKGKKGCYVATAVYGSYDCPQVWTLRRYRDYSLALTWYGRLFIALYYAISPTIVKWFGNTNWFNKMWKGRLDKMVKRLQEEGFENTPYEDKNW